MQTYNLTRTNGPPVKFVGELIGQAGSQNSKRQYRDDSARQWFTAELYRTRGGTLIAHVHYRAGSILGREEPKDHVVSAETLDMLIREIWLDFPSRWVTGWPGDASYSAQHASVVKYARSELKDLVGKIAELINEKVEVIE